MIYNTGLIVKRASSGFSISRSRINSVRLIGRRITQVLSIILHILVLRLATSQSWTVADEFGEDYLVKRLLGYRQLQMTGLGDMEMFN